MVSKNVRNRELQKSIDLPDFTDHMSNFAQNKEDLTSLKLIWGIGSKDYLNKTIVYKERGQ